MSEQGQGGQRPGGDDRENRDVLAGEYVLGTLSIAQRAEVERRMRSDADLRRAVEVWERRLFPLTLLASEVEPSPELWARIERRLADGHPAAAVEGARPPARGWRPWWDSLPFWRGLAGMGLAASFALGLRPGLLGPGDHPRYVVVLVAPGGEAPGWVVQVRAPGDAELAAIAQRPVPAERALELWTKADDWPAPVSLGLVRPGEPIRLRLDALPRLQPNQLFEITLEPPTGSPTGRPTGPIQYIGRAVALRI